MIDAHLPADFFEERACEDVEDESQHVFARACRLVVQMVQEDIEPNNGTFRSLLQFCKDEGSWQAAILLLEQSRRAGVKLNLFSFDLLIATVAEQGYEEVSTMLYEQGVVEADGELLEATDEDSNDTNRRSSSARDGQGDMAWPAWPLKVGARGGVILELHDLTVSIALATVQVALLDVARKPEGRAYWSGRKVLHIITGIGNNSKENEAVIKPAVVEMLESKGLKPEFQQNNEGCVELKPANLEAFAKRIKSQGGAAVARS